MLPPLHRSISESFTGAKIVSIKLIKLRTYEIFCSFLVFICLFAYLFPVFVCLFVCLDSRRSLLTQILVHDLFAVYPDIWKRGYVGIIGNFPKKFSLSNLSVLLRFVWFTDRWIIKYSIINLFYYFQPYHSTTLTWGWVVSVLYK